MARLLDGRAIAEDLKRALRVRVAAVESRGGRARLDALICGDQDDPAHVYATNQGRSCAQLGIEYKLHELPAAATFDDVAGRVLLLNTQAEVAAVMVHLPLPDGVDPYSIQRLIAPEKDVEGVNPANIGNVVYGRSGFAPCTALAVVKMIQHTGAAAHGGLRGKRAVVVGAGDVVGKPIAVLLMSMDATVISCNKWTPAIDDLQRGADVLVAAAGVPGLVGPGVVRPGAIVIDVGVSRLAGPDGKSRTVGDVQFDAVRDRLGAEGWISPVPGGVGPVTVMMLLENVVRAAERSVGLSPPDAPRA